MEVHPLHHRHHTPPNSAPRYSWLKSSTPSLYGGDFGRFIVITVLILIGQLKVADHGSSPHWLQCLVAAATTGVAYCDAATDGNFVAEFDDFIIAVSRPGAVAFGQVATCLNECPVG